MAKYIWNDGVLTVDFEDANFAPLTFNLKDAPQSLKDAAAAFGISTIVRNSTAGKMDDLAQAYAAAKAKVEVLNSGTIVAKGEAKAKVELSEDERTDVIRSVIITAKRSNGDKRSDVEIMQAFGALDTAKQAAVVLSLQKVIDKALKQRIAQKKQASKLSADGTSW